MRLCLKVFGKVKGFVKIFFRFGDGRLVRGGLMGRGVNIKLSYFYWKFCVLFVYFLVWVGCVKGVLRNFFSL